MRRLERIEALALVECKVPGCGWRAQIPQLYRLEFVDGRAGRMDAGGFDPRVKVIPDQPVIDAFEAYLAGHLVEHDVADRAAS